MYQKRGLIENRCFPVSQEAATPGGVTLNNFQAPVAAAAAAKVPRPADGGAPRRVHLRQAVQRVLLLLLFGGGGGFGRPRQAEDQPQGVGGRAGAVSAVSPSLSDATFFFGSLLAFSVCSLGGLAVVPKECMQNISSPQCIGSLLTLSLSL